MSKRSKVVRKVSGVHLSSSELLRVGISSLSSFLTIDAKPFETPERDSLLVSLSSCSLKYQNRRPKPFISLLLPRTTRRISQEILSNVGLSVRSEKLCSCFFHEEVLGISCKRGRN